MRLDDALRIGVEAARSAARGEPYEQQLTEAVLRTFDADSGAGLSRWHLSDETVEGISGVVLASPGSPQMTSVQVAAAEAAAKEHPQRDGLLSGPLDRVHRVSDVVPMDQFWASEVYAAMHAHTEGRFPAAVVLLRTPDSLVFLGIHRQRGDLTDAEAECLVALAEPLQAALAFRAALERAVSRLPWAPAGPDGPFTAREAEVIALVARGWTNRRIARCLGISESGVRQRLVTARERVAAGNRAELTARWNERRP
jgi:DNA-binding CsgD family transcriptional regulator